MNDIEINDQIIQPARSSWLNSRITFLFLFVSSILGATLWKAGVSETPTSSASQVGHIGLSVGKDVHVKSRSDLGHVGVPETPSTAIAKKILGKWEFSDNDASRVIVNREDGTATIDVTFGFVASFLYGSSLKLDLEWKFEDNVLTHTIVDGFPETGKKALIRDFGIKTAYKILKLTDGEMHLMEFGENAEDYLWVRSSEE